MGTDLICLQVRIDEKSKSDFRESVIQSTRQHVLKEGYVETAPENHSYFSGREIFIGPSSDSSWLTVLGFDTSLRELAKNLSGAFDTTVIFINLIDSDIVQLRRYDGGKIVDEYCNAPHLISLYVIDPDLQSEWKGIAEDDLIAMTKGNLEHWQDLFVAGVNPNDIRQIWDSAPVFADDILWATTEALGMNDEEIFYDYWNDSDQKSFNRLVFQIDTNNILLPPKLIIGGHNVFNEVFVNQQLILQIWILNAGRAFHGIDLLVWGTALDEEILVFSDISSVSSQGGEMVVEGAFTLTIEQEEEKEETFLEAKLADFDFPADIANGLETDSETQLLEKLMAKRQAGVQFNFPISITGTGKGEFSIAIIPHENRERGLVIHHSSIESFPMP